ncbi:hypothetical protein C8J55DRAFT_558079 [Lentinula edodes]|uniref:F-box domain-containing protein n=1 Tax=Lentinula lateritia TaxID=40482 RepID=A0A9W9ARP0_9AGAR|nr:hypothetical protein C8J55DRAFT_558079 [Lentinula edodes]
MGCGRLQPLWWFFTKTSVIVNRTLNLALHAAALWRYERIRILQILHLQLALPSPEVLNITPSSTHSGDASETSTISGKRRRHDEQSKVQESGDRPEKRAKTIKRRPKKKAVRRRKVPKRFKGVRGVFALLQRLWKHLPVEIFLYEIFGYLDSRDLLHLARTCKSIRQLLMTKSSDSIWRIARANIEGGLPPLPMDLNEPQFVTSHGNATQFCGGFASELAETVKKRVACFTIYNWVLRGELFPCLQILPQEKIKVKDRDTTVINYEVALKLKDQYEALEFEEDRRAWIKQKMQERRAVDNHARSCEAWHKDHLEQRCRQLDDTRNQRLQAILTRLELIGLRRDAETILMGESDFNTPEDLGNLRSVKQAKILTDRGWAHMKSELVRLLSEHKTKRLEREHNESCQKRYRRLQQEYFEFLSHRDLREPYPGLGDIIIDPVFKAMVWDTATEEELTPESVRSTLMEHLPRIAGEWRPSKIQEILQILRNVRPSATLSDLDLAVTIFGCARCNVLMSSSQVFYHPCCYNNRIIDDVGHHRMRTLNEHYDTEQDGSWSTRSLFFNRESSRFAETILIGTGLDPSTATTGDLTRAHPVIECSGPQEDAFPGRLFMTWPAALMYNQRIGEEIFFIINRFGQETSRIRIQEPLGIFSDVICCAHCHETIAVAALFQHLISWHNVNIRSTTITSTEFYKLCQIHWYWNPRDNLNLMGMDFRCR